MKNFIQPGHNLACIAPSNLKSGDPFLDGAEFSVASTDALAGTDVIGVNSGVFALPKAAVAVTRKTIAYYDNGAKLVTNVAAGNTKIGIFQAAAIAADATVPVLLVLAI